MTDLEQWILVVLDGRELPGLMIQSEVERQSDGVCKPSIGALSPVLARMVRTGTLLARWGTERPAERGGCRRRYYKLAKDTGKPVSADQPVPEGA